MTWPEALDSFEASISRVERGLRTGSWAPEAPWPPPGDLGPASVADLNRLTDLQARSARACDHLRAAMVEGAREIRLIGRRQQAAAGYARSQILSAGPAAR